MTTTQFVPEQPATISGLGAESDVVLRYFHSFNLGEYSQVASLFTEQGILYPPFEPPVVGPKKIADYLDKEADGMQVSLLSAKAEPLEQGRSQVDVTGKVTALVFKVNVTWRFELTSQHQIESVKVDLVATLEELLKIRPNQ
ncbi:MAG: ketosteroid isomerase family protein [Cyanobacteria bacterium P01_D01_bin.105]